IRLLPGLDQRDVAQGDLGALCELRLGQAPRLAQLPHDLAQLLRRHDGAPRLPVFLRAQAQLLVDLEGQGDLLTELLLELLELLAQDDGHDLGVLQAHPDGRHGKGHLGARLSLRRYREAQSHREGGDAYLDAVAVENCVVHGCLQTPSFPPASHKLPVRLPIAAAAQTQPAQAPASPAIEKGSTVQLEYTLKDDAGTLLDSNKGQAPLTYIQGEEHLMLGLEKQLVGMHPGEEKKVVLKPDEAYGPVNPTAETEVPKELLPPNALTVGNRLIARNADGEQRPVAVKEVKEKTVVLDLNHPLAGKTLVFELDRK